MLQGMSTPSLKPLRKPSAPAMELKERGDETDEHRQPADVGQRLGVHRAVVRQVHPTEPRSDAPDHARCEEGRDRRDDSDQKIGTDVRHEISA